MNNTPNTFTKILNGINTTLNFANRALPLYQQSKPLIKTVKDSYNNFKKNKDTIGNIIKLMKANKVVKNEDKVIENTTIKTYTNSNNNHVNNPTFFI